MSDSIKNFIPLGQLKPRDRFMCFGKLMEVVQPAQNGLVEYREVNQKKGVYGFSRVSELVEFVPIERCSRCGLQPYVSEAVGRVQGIPMCQNCLNCFRDYERRPL